MYRIVDVSTGMSHTLMFTKRGPSRLLVIWPSQTTRAAALSIRHRTLTALLRSQFLFQANMISCWFSAMSMTSDESWRPRGLKWKVPEQHLAYLPVSLKRQ
jgi:hypothetical protein